MPRRKAAKPTPITIDDEHDVEYEQPDKDGAHERELDEDLDVAHAISQLAGTAGNWATVHRVRDGNLSHVAKITDLAGFDLDSFGRLYGAGHYRMAFYRTGQRGMVCAPQNFTIDEVYGKGTHALQPAPAPERRDDARGDRFLELFISQTAESSRQLQTMMVAQQSQMTQILAAMISAKGTPASELAALMTVAREQVTAPDTLTEVVKTLPAAIQAAAASTPAPARPSPEQIQFRRFLARRRRMAALKKPLRLAQSSPKDAPPPVGTPPTPPPSESIQTAGMDPAAIGAAVLGIIKPHLTAARPKPLLAADALIETFGLETVESLLKSSEPYALTDQLSAAAPDIDQDAIAALEATLRAAVFGDDDGDDDDRGPDDASSAALSDEPTEREPAIAAAA